MCRVRAPSPTASTANSMWRLSLAMVARRPRRFRFSSLKSRIPLTMARPSGSSSCRTSDRQNPRTRAANRKQVQRRSLGYAGNPGTLPRQFRRTAGRNWIRSWEYHDLRIERFAVYVDGVLIGAGRAWQHTPTNQSAPAVRLVELIFVERCTALEINSKRGIANPLYLFVFRVIDRHLKEFCGDVGFLVLIERNLNPFHTFFAPRRVC